MAPKFQALLKQFKEAVNNLSEALEAEKTELNRDAAIKRFELAFDLSWKSIKALLEERGVRCASPLGCFKEAFNQGLLEYDDFWVEMVKTRNYTVHIYEEQLAESVFKKLPHVLSALRTLTQALEKDGQ